jgi:hypothetical protein
MGKERIAMLVRDGEAKNRSLWDSIQALVAGEIRFAGNDKAAEAGLASFARCIKVTQAKIASNEISTVSDLIDHVRKIVKYDDHLRKKFGPDADERIGNLEELKIFSNEVEHVTEENSLPDIGLLEVEVEEETVLSRFLGNIALMTDVRHAGEDKVDSVSVLSFLAEFRLRSQRYMQPKVHFCESYF